MSRYYVNCAGALCFTSRNITYSFNELTYEFKEMYRQPIVFKVVGVKKYGLFVGFWMEEVRLK